MKILGIDPGTATTGFGVIHVNGHEQYQVLDLGLVETSKDQPHGQRLQHIYDGVSKIIEMHQPEVVAIERLFFATNALTAIAVGQAIGVIKLAIHKHNLPVFDYTPMQVKLYVGGSGKADKKQMKMMVTKLLKVKAKKGRKSHFDDTADALAIAICHARKSIMVK
ncbi:crossover junction endodeoxyribonuclease RuvC [Candidatus Amesbacteria bacterium RIFCSPHIGHO2_01_FULL_48_32]|uniref:Crossover junction endodeoxyribonuclease RuvC n=1 Tax=Candidatus Amesbacteria bacterium RIFCSPLOWO2_01_FULL_48_25 TaxID=1797259 RepID=A0A1F4ZCI2_9BACT|nr:MAG: crossover junction endodeoxyribonuclease RuvC [Candidatus Amesbacteria bacterium RIFCSPHIGHO2_01_FULL_48_32]OGD03905.1 MAG: crossover junction endodeoxyribonuclease RuvC [Candidatus Amesbacteria bacterium RIFCSPLOWO2_01_FULL_48_25]HJZ05870.1 crossover junction endodeoxyribonuclease RuvC [Patescibacteria group bacterium]